MEYAETTISIHSKGIMTTWNVSFGFILWLHTRKEGDYYLPIFQVFVLFHLRMRLEKMRWIQTSIANDWMPVNVNFNELFVGIEMKLNNKLNGKEKSTNKRMESNNVEFNWPVISIWINLTLNWTNTRPHKHSHTVFAYVFVNKSDIQHRQEPMWFFLKCIWIEANKSKIIRMLFQIDLIRLIATKNPLHTTVSTKNAKNLLCWTRIQLRGNWNINAQSIKCCLLVRFDQKIENYQRNLNVHTKPNRWRYHTKFGAVVCK